MPSSGPQRAHPASRTAAPILDPAAVTAMQTRILSWYAWNGRDLPWRHASDPYAILVSEVMLQQTQVTRVVDTYRAFIDAYPTLETLAAAPLADVLRRWRGLGYNNRAERLWRCARLCVERRPPGRPAALPASVAALASLPGVGPYTARAVLAFSTNADVAAVDANVRRVLTHELGLPADLSPAALQAVAQAALPPGRSRDWHNALMDYGSLVLTSRTTGIRPRTSQGAFEGSRRWYRSRLLRVLLDDGPQPRATLAGALGVDEHFLDELVVALQHDGLVRAAVDVVSVA